MTFPAANFLFGKPFPRYFLLITFFIISWQVFAQPVVNTTALPVPGVYSSGQTMTFSVTFSETVIVTGNPYIIVNIGVGSTQAIYSNGSGTSTLNFNYSISGSDDGIVSVPAGSIQLNGGTIENAIPEAATLTLNGIETRTDVYVCILPTILPSAIGNTFCVGANGQISATAQTSGNGSGNYDFRLYDNAMGYIEGPLNAIGNTGVTFTTALTSGLYNVEVTDQTTGCIDVVSVVVNDNSIPPSINIGSIIITDVTGSSNGSLDATGTASGGQGGPYSYQWYADAGLSTPIGTGPVISGLDAGSYYLQVTEDATQCISIAETFTIQQVNNALNFDGTDDHVIVTNDASLNLDDGDFTIEYWARPETVNSSFHWVLGKSDGSNNATVEYLTGIHDLTNNWRFALRGLAMDVIGATTVVAGQYYHVACVFDGTEARLYVNGRLDGVASLAGSSLGALTNDVIIGARNAAAPSQFFDGSIDEVRFWNTARTQQEIIDNAYVDVTSNPDLISYYQFNEGAGESDNTGITTLPDQAGTNDGTLNGPFALSGTSSNWVTSTAWDADVFPPTMLSAITQDTDLDGQIDLITVNFSEDLDVASVTDPGGEFTIAGYTVASTVMNGTNAIDISLTPSGSPDTDQTPMVTLIAATLTDLNAVANVGETITPADGAAPILVSSSPADEATNVSVIDDFTLTFSEPILEGTGAVQIVDTGDGTGDQTISLPSGAITGYGTSTITINPAVDLEPTETYAIQIANTVFVDSNTNYYAGIGDLVTLNFTTDVLPNYALTFDGTGDFVDIGDVVDFPGDFTWEAMINAASLKAYNNIISKHGGGSTPMLTVKAGGELTWYYGGDARVSSSGDITTGQWYHVAAVRTSGIVQLYVDGSPVGAPFDDGGVDLSIAYHYNLEHKKIPQPMTLMVKWMR